jgi:hypothetical protein
MLEVRIGDTVTHFGVLEPHRNLHTPIITDRIMCDTNPEKVIIPLSLGYFIVYSRLVEWDIT